MLPRRTVGVHEALVYARRPSAEWLRQQAAPLYRSVLLPAVQVLLVGPVAVQEALLGPVPVAVQEAFGTALAGPVAAVPALALKLWPCMLPGTAQSVTAVSGTELAVQPGM